MIRSRKILPGVAVAIVALSLVSFSLVKISKQITFPDLSEKLENHFRRYPQQKAYLHVNKQAYHVGERLWYKAYLVDARSHQPDTISTNLVVELVNSFGQSSMIQIVKLENGYSRGEFFLHDTIPQGLYRLRAYTNWMRNFGEDYFFTREINIWNPENAVRLYREDKMANKRFKKKSLRKSEKLDIQFFPEGGYLVRGLRSRVGFKVINELGLGVDIEGEIKNRKNQTVVSFSSYHLGMGRFELQPEKGEKYTAYIRTDGDRTMRISLPEILDEGYVMHVSQPDESKARIQIQSNYPDAPVFLACHIRGKLTHAAEYALRNGEATVDIPLSQHPGGIMHITLFNASREPMCERLVFVPPDDVLNLLIEQDQSEYRIHEEVKLELTVNDADGNPVEGNFSLSVSSRDLDDYADDFQSSMVSNLLLSSDLSGKIENPDFYFRQNESRASEALDILLMTQGWRRFIWNQVINEKPLEINYPIQRGLSVTGRITRNFFNLPLKDIPVTLTVLSEFNDAFIDRTDQDGRFVFHLPDYEDTISVEIQARRKNGRKNLVIYIDDDDLPETQPFYSSYSRDMIVQGTNVFKPIPKEEQDTMAPRVQGIYSQPDYVLEVEEHMRNYSSVLEMMKGRIPGVHVVGNEVLIRGVTSMTASNEPLFLIDNVPSNLATVQGLNPMDIERIEVLKGPSASLYGIRGANGVISIYTRRGRYMIRGKLLFDMLGYHKPREFYFPKYGSRFDHLIEDKRSSLYWNPEVMTDAEGKAEISFFNSEKKGRFYIVVEGMNPSGQIGSMEKFYLVR